MKRFMTLAISFCLTIVTIAQKYVSFNKEVMKPDTKSLLNETLKDENYGIDKQKITCHATRVSKLSGIEHSTYHLTYGTIPMDFTSICVHSKDGFILSVNGNLSTTEGLDTIPQITPKEALQLAIKYDQADSYSWQVKPSFLSERKETQYLLHEPIPQLVICPNFNNVTKIPTLAYKVELFSIIPFAHKYVYINANDGDIIYVHPLLKSLNGIAETRYSGTQTISTSYMNNSYCLVDETRENGIYTYIVSNAVNVPTQLLTDNDNVWTSNEYHNSKKDAALDAHWGVMMAHDFFRNMYGKTYIDNTGNPIRNYVNSPIGNNAMWDCSAHSIFYGPGYDSMDVVTSLDVVAHEYGHGITDSYQEMLYEGETGAINESLSDIWGACVECYTVPTKHRWWIGEDIALYSPAIRYMDNPNLGENPDTYWGTYYLDPATNASDAVVHCNSGVPNHWFYLLSNGGHSTNDHGYSYSVDGIGIFAAADIVYESLNYLQNEMTFAEFAAITREVASNIYGVCANETSNLIEAWKAVGIPIEDIPETLYITEALQTGNTKRYFAQNLLVASNVVQNGATEILESENQIVLGPGFYAKLGASVTATIIFCDPSNERNEFSSISRIGKNEYPSVPFAHEHDGVASISPNPAIDIISITGVSENTQYVIYDSMGKMVKIGILNAPYCINVAQLSRGTYILRIAMNDGFSYVKFLKQ